MLKKRMLYFFLCGFTMLSTAVFAQNSEECSVNDSRCTKYQETNFWQYPQRAYIGHTEGNWLGTNQGYTSLGLFSPIPFCEKSAFKTFVDIRGHFFNNGKLAANAGIGLRYQRDDSSQIFGINAFYDYREASWDHDFQQVGLGFEYLTSCFDFRLNTYLPICDNHATSSTTVYEYLGGYLATRKQRQLSYGGADFELGTWMRRKESCNFFDLYGAVGAYYYDGRKHERNEYGSQARLEAYFLNYFRFEIKGGFDTIYHGMAQGSLSVGIPLDVLFDSCRKVCCNTVCQDRAIYQPVHRNEIITLSKKRCCWTWNWDSPPAPR